MSDGPLHTTMCSKCGADCQTFGECLRNKGIRVGWSRSAAGFDLTSEKASTRELSLYAAARHQGIQPAGTRTAQIRAALDQSDLAGTAFNAATGPNLR